MYLSLSPNTQLCGSCSYKLMNDKELAEDLMIIFKFGDITDGIGSEDFVGVFGTPETQCTKKKIDDYCKFSAVDSGKIMVAWS